MSNVQSLKPVQFNFLEHWKEIKNHSALQSYFKELHDSYCFLAEDIYESELEAGIAEPEQSKAEYELRLHTVAVKQKDYHWLQEHFSPVDFGRFCEAIGDIYYPNKTWDWVENDEEIVVSDTDRTIVFDFMHGRDRSAELSLAISGDKNFASRPEVTQVVNQMTLEKIEKLESQIAIMARALSEHKADVLPIDPTKT